MDRPWLNDQLGVNNIGKNIKKSPLHQPNFANGIEALPQSQVYNVSKNDFRSVIQQLTGSPLPESFPQPPPPQNLPKWLLKIRLASLAQITRPRVPAHVMAQPTHNLAARPPPQPYVHSLPHGSQLMMGHGDQCWLNTVESPVSLYMCYLQSSLVDSGQNGNQMQPSHVYQSRPPPQLLNHHSPRLNVSAPILPTPRFNGPPQRMHNNNNLPSPRFNGRGILPSPTSQYLLRSPTAYRNFPSPRSPYPLLLPGVQYPSPRTPINFTFSSMDQPGILGPGKFPYSPASPGLVLPSSPFGFSQSLVQDGEVTKVFHVLFFRLVSVDYERCNLSRGVCVC